MKFVRGERSSSFTGECPFPRSRLSLTLPVLDHILWRVPMWGLRVCLCVVCVLRVVCVCISDSLWHAIRLGTPSLTPRPPSPKRHRGPGGWSKAWLRYPPGYKKNRMAAVCSCLPSAESYYPHEGWQLNLLHTATRIIDSPIRRSILCVRTSVAGFWCDVSRAFQSSFHVFRLADSAQILTQVLDARLSAIPAYTVVGAEFFERLRVLSMVVVSR